MYKENRRKRGGQELQAGCINFLSADDWIMYFCSIDADLFRRMFLNYSVVMRDKNFYDRMGAEILDTCIAVHRELGPGFLESVYQYALLREFEIRGISAIPQVRIPLWYKGYYTGKDFFIDLLVENEILLEIKSVETLHPVFRAQVITYLRLSGKYLGYLINFNVPLLRNGFFRLVNQSITGP